MGGLELSTSIGILMLKEMSNNFSSSCMQLSTRGNKKEYFLKSAKFRMVKIIFFV